MPLDRRRALKYAAAGVSWLLPACRRDAPAPAAPQPSGERSPGGLRVELRHTRGSADDERFLPTRLRAEPQWSGPRTNAMLAPDWGDYRFDVIDRKQGTLLHRAGFESPAGPGASGSVMLRAPYPDTVAELSVARRRAGSLFQSVWSFTFDPRDVAIDRSPARTVTTAQTLRNNGSAATHVDIAILGDGYRDDDRAKFFADARRAEQWLFSVEPFRSRAGAFNVHAVFTASAERGVTDAYTGKRSSTAFTCSYGTGSSERTLSVGDDAALREAAASVPYDYMLVLANSRRYGGSAHLGGPAVVAIDSASARYLVIHELAHAFAGLADEYYIPSGSGPAYNGNIEPWNPNVTLSPASGKWSASDMRAWNKTEYDADFARYVRRYLALRESRASEERVERLMEDARRRQRALLDSNPRGVGYFEGANGFARGVFRSEVDCIMFSLQSERFCAACTGAINRVIDYHSA